MHVHLRHMQNTALGYYSYHVFLAQSTNRFLYPRWYHTELAHYIVDTAELNRTAKAIHHRVSFASDKPSNL